VWHWAFVIVWLDCNTYDDVSRYTSTTATASDFKWLQSFVDARRKVYGSCYKQLRDKVYAHKKRADITGFVAKLGAAASSRLFLNLREEKGYTYGAYSNVTGNIYPGIFVAGTEARNAVTDGSMHELLGALRRAKES
jgi:hypothetical protein